MSKYDMRCIEMTVDHYETAADEEEALHVDNCNCHRYYRIENNYTKEVVAFRAASLDEGFLKASQFWGIALEKVVLRGQSFLDYHDVRNVS